MPHLSVSLFLLLCIPLLLTLPSGASASCNRARRSDATCPLEVRSHKDFGDALECMKGACGGCDEVVLVGDDGLSVAPSNGTVFDVFRSVTIRGGQQVVWDMGHEAGFLRLASGARLSLCEITIATRLQMATKPSFLVPTAVAGATGRGLELVDVTFITPEDVLNESIAFVHDDVPRQAFRVEEVRGGCGKKLTVKDWKSSTVTASNVSLGCWNLPLLGSGNRLQVTHSKQLQEALEHWDSLIGIDEIDIVKDIVFDPVEWPEDGIRLTRNVTLRGVAAEPPLIDFRLMSDAVKLERNTTVLLENVMLINLALAMRDPQYGALLWFFEFDRLRATDPEYHIGVVVQNSTLMVSCEELEHYQYTVALIMDPLQTILQDHNNVTQAVAELNFQVEAEQKIRVENGTAFGVAFSNVIFTCNSTPGVLLESDHTLESPLRPLNSSGETPTTVPSTLNGGETPTTVPSTLNGAHTDSQTSEQPAGAFLTDEGNEESSGGGPETSTMFKVLLGLLVPMFLVLGIAFLYKVCCSNKETLDVEKDQSPKIVVELGDGHEKDPSTTPLKRQRTLPRGESARSYKLSMGPKSPRESFKGTEDTSTAPSNETDGKKLQAPNVGLPRINMAGSPCAEFIPDILAVSEDIDDKQLVLHELLGKGVHGTVHKGVWRELDVAVKTIVFHGNGESNQDWQQSAIREVAITSGLAHQNLVCTYSYDIKRLHTGAADAKLLEDPKQNGLRIWDTCVDWKLYIIQEYCDGGNLQEALKNRAFAEKRYGGPDLESVLELASGIARGLHHIHSKNIIHGDLKPSNVLLKKVQETHAKVMAKIADFGLSLKMQGSQTHVSNCQHGTSGYMAPEVEEEGSCSKAADIYAYGVVLWDIFMSQLSPTGVPSPEMRKQFPRLPWSCPALYGVLTVACTRLDPSARPSCGDILELLVYAWQQLHMGTLSPPALSPLLRLQQKAREIAVTCRCVDQTAGQRFPEIDGHEEMVERRRNYFAKASATAPALFRSVEYEEVYWSESTLE